MNMHLTRTSVLLSLSFVFAQLTVLVDGGIAAASVGSTNVAVWKDNAKSAYSLSIDDCRPSQVYVVAPALTERGLRGTFYVNTGDEGWYNQGWNVGLNIGDVNSDGKLDGYLHLPEQGHELGAHTQRHWSVVPGLSHPGFPGWVFPSYEAFHADNLAIKQKIETLTGQKVVSFAYPFGYCDEPSKDVARQDYLSARDTGYIKPHWDGYRMRYLPNPATPADMSTIHCFYVEGAQPWGNFGDYAQASSLFQLMLNDTVLAGGWGVEYFHSTGNDWQDYYSDWGAVDRNAYYEHLDNIVNKVQSGDVWEDTVGNVVRYLDSRKVASVTQGQITSSSISLSVNDGLDDSMFNVPLTLNTEIPASWADELSITHDGQSVSFTIGFNSQLNTTYASYNVVADGGLIRLFVGPTGGPTPPVPGDYNSDGVVDTGDYVIWRRTLNSTTLLDADGDQNGIVDEGDYLVWKSNFGESAPPATGSSLSAAVPEPDGLILTALAGLIVRSKALRRRRAMLSPTGSLEPPYLMPAATHLSATSSDDDGKPLAMAESTGSPPS